MSEDKASTSASATAHDVVVQGGDDEQLPPGQGEDVDKFLDGESPDVVLNRFQDNYSTYRQLEMQMQQRKAALKQKIPEIKSTLGMVKYLVNKRDAKEEFESSYEVADHLYAKAKIADPTHANTMVEYSLEEAIELLEKNLKNADANMLSVNSDLQFLREQITTTEVNIARIYNYDVIKKRAQRNMMTIGEAGSDSK